MANEEEVETLKREIFRLRKVNQALMGRVERSIENQGNAFSLFEGNITLSAKVNQRTAELNRANEALAREKSKLGKILMGIPGVFLVFDGHSVLIERVIGLGPCPPWLRTGRKLGDFSPAFVSAVEEAMGDRRSGVPKFFKFSDVADNDRRHFNASLSTLDDHEFVIGVVDVTEQVRSEERMRNQEAMMVQASKLSSLGEMAGGIAHEINNPLAIISARASVLQTLCSEDVFDRESARTELEKIGKTVRRIAKIVKGLRTFSRSAENDPMVETPLREIIDETLSLCHERFKTSAVSLTVGSVPDISIRCRATQISQVLINLLNNSYDAIEKLPDRWVRVELETGEAAVTIRVVDSGAGIPPAIRGKIMNPFFTTKEIGKGTGLGLSVSKGIIDEHGGMLRVPENVANTTFVIELPSPSRRAEG